MLPGNIQLKCVKTTKVCAEDCFLFDIYEEVQKIKDVAKCSANTLKNNECTLWAMHAFETWQTQRSKQFPDDQFKEHKKCVMQYVKDYILRI